MDDIYCLLESGQKVRIIMRYSVNVNVLEKSENSIKGFASVLFAECLMVGNIAIVENQKGELFVSMPRYASNKDASGYKDICNPITKEFREELYGKILQVFKEAERGGNKKMTVGNSKDMALAYNVKVTPFEREGSNIRGLARVYIDDRFVISNISLLEGKKGIFVAMPSYKTKQTDENGKSVYQDICYPVTKEFREKLYGNIKEAYNTAKKMQQENSKNIGGEGDVPVNAKPTQDCPFR